MIAELFYPRELKEIIAELRAKNDLNEESELNLRRFFYHNFFGLNVSISAIVLFTEEFLYFFILLLIPFVLKFEGKRHINRKLMPFVRGRRETLTMVRSWISMIAVKLVLEDDDGNRYVAPHITDKFRKEERKGKGDRVICYISANNPRLCFPAFPRFMRKYCLSKSIIRENEQ